MRQENDIITVLTIENKILIKIKKAGRGTLFFTDSFINIGNQKAVSKALQRLVKSGEIVRVARGIYIRPEKDPVLGYIYPGIEKIAGTIAKKDKARIIPTGSYALNKLGLSSQVPMNVVFLTDGSARKIRLGKKMITFKKVSPKHVSAVGPVSRLVIQALRETGKSKMTDEEIRHIQELLKKENPNYLRHDLRTAPEWIRRIMRQSLLDQPNG